LFRRGLPAETGGRAEDGEEATRRGRRGIEDVQAWRRGGEQSFPLSLKRRPWRRLPALVSVSGGAVGRGNRVIRDNRSRENLD
jgi:hypothetical protein